MELTGQGLIVMMVGLGVVFLFLIALILSMVAGSRLFMRLAHLLPDEPSPGGSGPDRDAGDHGAVVAAIAAMLHARRARRS